MITKATGIICVVLFTSATTPATTAEWKPTKSKDGIRSYVGTTASNGVTPTRVEMNVSAPVEKVVSVIADLANYSQWVPYCKQSSCLQKVSDTVCYGYQRISAPMVTDRDLAVRMTVRKMGNKNYEVLLTAVPSFIQQQSKALRIQHLITHYHVYAAADGTTNIVQVNEVNIGGTLPAFLLNWANNNQPLETFQNLRNQILTVKN